MPTTVHSTMTGTDLHEPKGVASAADETVYVADNAGSGAWKKPEYALHCAMDDLSTAHSHFLVIPFSGDITKIYTVLIDPITGADAGFTFEIGGVPITGSAITITQVGSAAGDVDSSTPTALNTVAGGQTVEIISDGAPTGGGAECNITFVITP